MQRVAVAVLVAASGWAGAAWAQGEVRQSTLDDLQQQCRNLMLGEVPSRQSDADALRKRCADLMTAGAQAETRAAEQEREAQQARVQPGQAQQPPQQGQGVAAAFTQAGRELVGRAPSPGPGRKAGGEVVMNTLTSDAVGWFSGLGVNAVLSHVLAPDLAKFSWVTGLRYSRTTATNGDATTFGLMGGADWYIIGRNNEGLRIGPRLELAVGSEAFGGSTTFARLGLAGELGYNFIASNGITAELAVGMGGRLAGHKNDNFSGFTGSDLGPYVSLGLGYSW
jgi:hypothetical protein